MNQLQKRELPDNYTIVLKEIKSQIEVSQIKVVLAANQELLWLYWMIGNKILEQKQKEGWGAKVIERLSKDIKKEYPKLKGFSVRNLTYMQKFASYYTAATIIAFSEMWKKLRVEDFTKETILKLESFDNKEDAIVQELTAQFKEQYFLSSPISRITWTHHMGIMDKLKDYPDIFWYMLNTIEHGISSNIMKMQIEMGLYERQVKSKKITNFSNTLPPAQSDLANYLMKDPYIFDFVQAKEKADERDIEEQLEKHISKFLLELGQGFAFIGRQYHLEVGDKDYYIDLLFYHLKLRCYVVVELKSRSFKPGDTGQLNFYLNVINDLVKAEHDNDTIGILLCKGKDEVLAEYALKGYNQPMGIADYELSKSVPENIKSELPDIEDLEKQLEID